MARHVLIAMVSAVLGGCAALAPPFDRGNPTGATPGLPDRDQVQAAAMLEYLASLHSYTKAPPEQQAALFLAVREAYEAAVTPSTQLRYALMLAVPGHPASDPRLAQQLLRQLLSAPAALAPSEHAAAFLELQRVDRELALSAENERLRQDKDRDEREKLAALQRRLSAETEENQRLRRELDEAESKLDAIALIERQTSRRGNTPPPPPEEP
jgi:hypothetical protein